MSVTVNTRKSFQWPLQRISKIESDLLKRLAQLKQARSSLCWLPGYRSTGDTQAIRLTLDIGGESVPVYVCRNRTSERLGLHSFATASAIQQAALWSMRGGRLWQALENFCGAPILVKTALTEILPGGWMRFSLSLGRAEIGCWLEAESLLRALLARPVAPGPLLPALSQLRFVCALRAPSIVLATEQLQDLKPGDLLVLSFDKEAPLLGQLLLLGSTLAYPVLYDRSGIMTIDNSVLEINEDVKLPLRGEMEITLSVELATCTLSLAELAALRSGSTLRLNKQLDELTVLLKHHGQRVASGSLLDIGGVLGIHVIDVALSTEI